MARETMNLLVNHIHNRELLRYASRYLRGRSLDIGCGAAPYRKLLAPYVERYVGVDHNYTLQPGLDRPDVLSTAYSIPMPDSSFDSAICTAVLEHLEEPERALRECHRVLKPGGTAIYTVPFIWHLHEEPRDFYRFTKYGLAYMFEKTGFEVVELQALSGFWVTFGQLLVYNLYRFNRGPLRWFGIVPLAGLMIQAVAYPLDKIDRSEGWTWMYLVVARRKAAQAQSGRSEGA